MTGGGNRGPGLARAPRGTGIAFPRGVPTWRRTLRTRHTMKRRTGGTGDLGQACFKSMQELTLNESSTATTTAGPAPAGTAGATGAAALLEAAGRELAAAVDPRAVADREIALFLNDRPVDIIFFFGFGQGWHAEALRARTSAAVCVYEPCAGTREALARGELAAPDGVTVVGTLAGVMGFAAARNDMLTCRLLAGAVPALRQEYPVEFARFVEAVKQARADAELLSSTFNYTAARWVRHLAQNLPHIAAMPPLDALAGAFSGHAGIVIGAGPSLDGCLDTLRALQGRAVLCAVSTALPALARAGVTPDIVVAIEGHDLSAHFTDVPNLERMALLPGPVGNPAHFAVPTGRRFAHAPRGCAVSDWLERAWGCRQLPSGGSVACTAFSALHLLGCDPLVLVGMDLALTDGRTHAGHTVQGTRRVRLDPATGQAYHWMEDRQDVTGHWSVTEAAAWGGDGRVLTRPVFNSFRLWFEGAAETWARERRLVNATGGGARIHGFDEVRLAAWLEQAQPAPVAFDEVTARALASATPVDVAALWREVAAELAVVAEAGAAATTAERLAARALKDMEARRYAGFDGLLARLGAAETRMGELTRSTRLLNTLVGEKSLALAREGATRSNPGDKVASTHWSLQQSRAISRLVIEGAAELAELYGPLAALAGAPAAPAPEALPPQAAAAPAPEISQSGNLCLPWA